MLGLGLFKLEILTDGSAIHPRENRIVEQSRADGVEFAESDQVIVLQSARPGGPQVASREGLRFLARLHRELAAIPGVYGRRVRSLASLVDPQPEIAVILSPDFLEKIPDDEAGYAALLERIRRSPLAPGLFLAPGGRAAAFYVPTLRGASRSQLVTDLERLLRAQPTTFELRLTGPVAAEVMLGRAILRDLMGLVPVMVAAVAILLFLCLRSVGGVLVPMAEILMVLVCTVGAMGHLGIPITLVTTILPVLLMTLAVTDEIHLLERFRSLLSDPDAVPDGPDKTRTRAAMRLALRQLARPIVLTSLTTAIGLLSFATSTIEPIRHFGVFAALGVMLAMGFSLSFAPAFAILLPPWFFVPRGSRRPGSDGAELTPLDRWLTKHGFAASLIGVTALALTLPGLLSLSVQDAWVDNFARDSELVSAERDFNEAFWGSYRFDVVLEGADPFFFFGADGLRLTSSVARAAAAAPHVGGVLSHSIAYQIVADVWREPGTVDGLPAEKLLQITRLVSGVSHRTDVDQVLSPNGAKARIRLFVKSASYERARQLQLHLEREIPKLLAGTKLRTHFSGDLPLATAVVGDIVGNMLRSIAWSAAGVWILLAILYRSVFAAASAVTPLVAAILILLGSMGYAGMPLGIATSMFAAVAIGVGVDFSIHFFHGYGVQRDGGADHATALEATLRSVGRSIRWNAIVVALGLSVLALSSLKPNRSLGVLLSASMVACYATTILLLPSLLKWLASGKPSDRASFGRGRFPS